MTRLYLLTAALALTACTTETLATYEPVVDRPGNRYAADLAECRALGATAEAEYTRRMGNEMAANLILGALAGAAIGGSYGDSYVNDAALYGAMSGVGATDTEQAYGGPRRIVDRCLASRGHTVLSDVGRG